MPKLPNGQRHHWFKLGKSTVAYIREMQSLYDKGEKLKGPDELRRVLGPLGALKPSRQVMVNGTNIEAHIIWPDIFDGIDANDDNFYMAVPYDYKGDHFVPADGTPLDDATKDKLLNLIGLAWGGKVPCIILRPPMEIDIPADFDKNIHDYAEGCSYCSSNFQLLPSKPKGPR